MIRIAALNDSSSESCNEEDNGPSQEALEAEATCVYRKGISHLAKEENDEAKICFLEVLKNPYTDKACWRKDTDRTTTLPQDIALKYSCLKNLGNLHMSSKDYKNACIFYLKAVELDASEVTLWQKLGAASIKIKDFQLALTAFQEGLLVNPSHWPCLDQLLSVLFLLGFYEDCLGFCVHSLKRDPGYIKALAFKDKIFVLQPSLKQFSKDVLPNSEILFKQVPYDKERGDKFIETCFQLRPAAKESQESEKIPSIKVTSELSSFHWGGVMKAIINTYDYLLNKEGKAFAGRLELEELITKYVSSKFGPFQKLELKSFLKASRRLNRSLSCPVEHPPQLGLESLSKSELDISDTLIMNKASSAKIGCTRRKTIQIGENQESFRMEDRKSDLDTIVELPQEISKEENKTDNSIVPKAESVNKKSPEAKYVASKIPESESKTSQDSTLESLTSKIPITESKTDMVLEAKPVTSKALEKEVVASNAEEATGIEVPKIKLITEVHKAETPKSLLPKALASKESEEVSSKIIKEESVTSKDSEAESATSFVSKVECTAASVPVSALSTTSSPVPNVESLSSGISKTESITNKDLETVSVIEVQPMSKINSEIPAIKTVINKVQLVSTNNTPLDDSLKVINEINPTKLNEIKSNASSDNYNNPDLNSGKLQEGELSNLSEPKTIDNSSGCPDKDKASKSEKNADSQENSDSEKSPSLEEKSNENFTNLDIECLSKEEEKTGSNSCLEKDDASHFSADHKTKSKTKEISEALVNQLNDIIAMKPSTQILGALPISDFDFEDSDFAGDDFFEEGVDYEDEPLMEVDNEDQEKRYHTEEEEEESDKAQNELNKDEEPKKETKKEIICDDNKNVEHKTTVIVAKPIVKKVSEIKSPKKLKRTKRGLERELEQLDYWGRRKAREAKRRRRTLTSRLVNSFEENECLTWEHLLRSFIPAGLLVADESNPTTEHESSDLNSSAKECKSQELLVVSINKDAIETTTSAPDSNHQPDTENYSFMKKYSAADLSKWKKEELQVGEFLHKNQQNGGILDVMQRCLKLLIEKSGQLWSLEYALAFKEIYCRVRKHIMVGATLSLNEDPKRLYKFAKEALINLELLVSLYRISEKNKKLRGDANLHPNKIFSNELLEDDIFHLELLLGRPDVWDKEYLQAHLRLRWSQSQMNLALGNYEVGTAHLVALLDEITLSTPDDGTPIHIDRCRLTMDDAVISKNFIENELSILQRSQLLEKVEGKFNSGFHEEVINILLPSFDGNLKVPPDAASSPPRNSQLIMLIESIVKVKSLTKLVIYGGKCLSEALRRFNKCVTLEEKQKWSLTIESICISIFPVIDEKPSLDDDICKKALPNFLSPLVDILVMQLEQTSGNYPYFNTLIPWLLVHNILSMHERMQHVQDKMNPVLQVTPEKKDHKLDSTMETDDNEKKDEILDSEAVSDDANTKVVVSPDPSTLLLITAHEELGKNSWCCHGGGLLLLRMLDVLLEELQKSLSDEQKVLLFQSLEQVVFCLYGHPSKKSKTSFLSNKLKHLKDHGVQAQYLTWDVALKLYKFFAPSQLPEFESSQIASLTDDISSLFKRIVSVLPSDFIYTNQTESIDAYLNGETPEFHQKTLVFPSEIKDVYYLLADFYFKSKDWYWAIFYYKLDVSINPTRLDAWAPMGLAKKAQLETLLNSCDVIVDEKKFFTEAYMASRCLRQALTIDEGHCNLWVEKGGLVYMIFSHASRLLKQDLNPDVSIERFEYLEKVKEEMMQEAIVCFKKALQIDTVGLLEDCAQDERWLYQYMLGKLAEKSFQPPQEILNHYLAAAELLRKKDPKYPSKISYNNPQEYAVEMLEIYYRIYTFIFKYLHQREGKDIDSTIMDQLTLFADNADQFPFVKGNDNSEDSKKRPLENDNEVNDNSKKLKKEMIDSVVTEMVDKVVQISFDKKTCKSEEVKSSKDDDIQVIKEHVEKKESYALIKRCIQAWKLCLSRFSHHYKSLYRLAYYFHHSKFHKDNEKARNFLLGSENWQKFDYMPTNGLFFERKIYLQNVKNCNLFHSVWRIPHDEIDRAGSFAAHMHRSLSLCLDVLQSARNFFAVFEIALSLKHSPDKDKKYLRDNERELLSEHATQVGLQVMKDKCRILIKKTSPADSERQNFLVEVHKVYKHISRHFPSVESPVSRVLVDAFASFKNMNSDNFAFVLKEAESYCTKNVLFKPKGLNTARPATAPRRGRPPSSSLATTSKPVTAPTNQSVAVQQAYKVYENLIHAQTFLGGADAKTVEIHKKKYEEYKKQMLKYLQIPSVSQFFHASLKNLGSCAAKLPPPTVTAINNSAKTSLLPQTQSKHSISSLAARSQAHGISISAVPKKIDNPCSKSLAPPSMSITVSGSKPTVTSINSQSGSMMTSALKDTYENIALPKLPPGTTLSRHTDQSSLMKAAKMNDIAKMGTSIRPVVEALASHNSVSITAKETKVPSSSFQDAFQAAIAKGNLPLKEGIVSTVETIKVKPAPKTNPRLKDPLDLHANNVEEDIITLD